jgi:hypothetical protein
MMSFARPSFAITPDQYLSGILARESVDTGLLSPVRGVQAILHPLLQRWAGNRLVSVDPSGSFMKGTANLSGTDIDIFVSLSDQTTETLKEIYEKLLAFMKANGYVPTRQNVSIGLNVNGCSVDLVPAKRQNSYGDDHSLYTRRTGTWTKTNVVTHINHVAASGRQNEMRILKLWRDQKRLDFPSFFLELIVIEALPWHTAGTLSDNVFRALQYIKAKIATTRIIDPANTNNVISADLSSAEKTALSIAAEKALQASTWSEIVV